MPRVTGFGAVMQHDSGQLDDQWIQTPGEYVAELSHVREVSLLGTARLEFWNERLKHEGLAPAEVNGRAQGLVTAAESRFMGMPFAEVSFCVLVWPPPGAISPEAAYLLRAFNSSRLLAFCERTFCSTPYYHGNVHVVTAIPACVHLAKGGEVVFRAQMGANAAGSAREPTAKGERCWSGPVFLPRPISRRNSKCKFFFARLAGRAKTYPFLGTTDSITLRHFVGCEILRALIDSGYEAEEWAVREDATHSKSKTYKQACKSRPRGAASPVLGRGP